MKCHELIPSYICYYCKYKFPDGHCRAEGIASYLDDVLYDRPLKCNRKDRLKFLIDYINGMTIDNKLDLVVETLLKLPKYHTLAKILMLQ